MLWASGRTGEWWWWFGVVVCARPHGSPLHAYPADVAPRLPQRLAEKIGHFDRGEEAGKVLPVRGGSEGPFCLGLIAVAVQHRGTL